MMFNYTDNNFLVKENNQGHGAKNRSPVLVGLRVLVVDNDIDTSNLFCFILETEGAKVIEVASSQAAVLAVQQACPDVLISDICLPDEDGYTLLQKVTAITVAEGKQLPAIAVTGLFTEEDCQKLAFSGFQKHLPKPTDPDELVTAVVEVIGRSSK
ncbi:response regulator [Leptolyngbya sp. FACHB-8]|nr:response regulator [Leptolyngbya sp. FACHB-8]MBD1913262.1 response regulator [Leptolyngbya sp. FACHB-8]